MDFDDFAAKLHVGDFGSFFGFGRQLEQPITKMVKEPQYAKFDVFDKRSHEQPHGVGFIICFQI